MKVIMIGKLQNLNTLHTLYILRKTSVIFGNNLP